MKNNLFQLANFVSKIKRQHLQLVLLLITLAMLVLGAGAPVDVGGIGLK